MADIRIVKGRDGRASVFFNTPAGWLFLTTHMQANPLQPVTVPNELADELVDDIKKIDGGLDVEIK